MICRFNIYIPIHLSINCNGIGLIQASYWMYGWYSMMDSNFHISSTTQAEFKPKGSIESWICLVSIYLSSSTISPRAEGRHIHRTTAMTAMAAQTRSTVSFEPQRAANQLLYQFAGLLKSFQLIYLLPLQVLWFLKNNRAKDHSNQSHWVWMEWEDALLRCSAGGAGRTHDLLVCLSTPDTSFIPPCSSSSPCFLQPSTLLCHCLPLSLLLLRMMHPLLIMRRKQHLPLHLLGSPSCTFRLCLSHWLWCSPPSHQAHQAGVQAPPVRPQICASQSPSAQAKEDSSPTLWLSQTQVLYV